MTPSRKLGFRFVPWQWSWKWFGLIFAAFFALNYAVVRYSSKHALFGEQSDTVDRSIKSIQAALDDQSNDLLTLRRKINEIRITSENQRQIIQTMQKSLEGAGGRLSTLSKEADGLLKSNEGVSSTAEREEETLDRIQKTLADIKVDVQQMRDALALSGSKP